ncbi:MAG: hypothetical protein Q7V88_09220 [Actinomycetota bacterium]|nr:hypothetical protein [Actinomycetota bacterium]
MSALGSARRRRTTVMLVINLVALLVLGGMGYAGYIALRNYEGATKVGAEFVGLPTTPVGMMGIVDADNRLTSLALFVLRPTQGTDEASVQRGGTIVPVPVTADTTLGVGEQRIPLAGVYAEGGADALVLAVESTLSITLDVATVATPAEAEALLQAVSPIRATFATEVVGRLDGKELSLYDAGENTLSATQAVQVLTATVEGQTDRQRRANVEAVWAAVAAAVGEGVSAVAADAPVASLADLVSKLFAGRVDARVLPADPIDDSAAPEGLDVESIDRAEAIWVLATIAPKSMSAPAPGLVFRIEAPPGYETRVKFAIKALLFLGANVSSVYLQGPVQEATIYLIADPRIAAQAESSNELFGLFELAEPEMPTEGIDVVLQLGTDFLTGEGETLPTTTSTEPA